ncbi:hypothetical protein AYO20_00179 [Fonsecaea nubica]|uniref:Phenylacetaldoxime dehydratase n=1 Tax=Fonsecaea nubica TaxID=856822 RepID=A0A178DGV3_9EURO|nr:hypothetical protein AYO20_00179 [Fonsecaea nubica]OAL40443.1 hypothetical protein AYO20_00179 [Fonsecaea nubica]
MPLLSPRLPERFTIAIFGAQFHGDSPSEAKSALIDDFEGALEKSAVSVENLWQDDTERGLGLSRVWVSYWKSPSDYEAWWKSAEVSRFWSTLPDDSGFWRETLHFSSSRFVTETSQDIPNGVGHLGPLEQVTEKTGYWGSLRDRIKESTATDKLPSPLASIPPPRAPDGSIRRGRVKMTTFPNNISFVTEGQDHNLMKDDELQVWSAKFHWATKRFVTNVPSTVQDDPDIFPQLEVNRTVELLYLLDFRYMERLGRSDKAHLALRQNFMDDYGPDGVLAKGDMCVWADCGVLRAEDMLAEYIGCYEGTGFLAYDHHPEFKSTTTSSSNGAWSRVTSFLGLS